MATGGERLKRKLKVVYYVGFFSLVSVCAHTKLLTFFLKFESNLHIAQNTFNFSSPVVWELVRIEFYSSVKSNQASV